MRVDMYGHAIVNSQEAMSGRTHKSAASLSDYYESRSRTHGTKEGNVEKRFIFKKTLPYVCTLVMALSSTLQISRFVHKARKHQGVAFLIPFTILYVLLGLPIILTQMFIGQYARVGVINMWQLSPLGAGIGYVMVLISVVKAASFGRSISLGLIHIPLAMQSGLPWVDCGLFPDRACVDGRSYTNTTYMDALKKTQCCAKELDHNDDCEVEMKDPILFASLLWHNGSEFRDGDYKVGDKIKRMNYQLCGCLIFGWSIMCIILLKRMRFFSKLIVPTTCIIGGIFITLWVIILFDGGQKTSEGIKFFFDLKLEDFRNDQVWLHGFDQVCEGLLLMYGTPILISSYAPKKTNPITMTVSLGFIKYTILMLLTLMYAALGSLVAADLGAPSPRCIQTEGWSVLYVNPAQYFGMMAHGSFWTILYFLMLFLNDMLYTVLLLVATLESLWEAWPKLTSYRTHITLGVCFFCFMCGLPMLTDAGYVIKSSLVSVILPGVGVMTLTLYCVFVMWIYGVIRLSDDIEFLVGKPPSQYWTLLWYLIPLAMIGYQLPHGIAKLYRIPIETSIIANQCSVIILLSPIVFLALFNCMVYFRTKNLYRVVFPAATWGPADPEERRRRQHFNPRKVVRFSVHAPLKFRPAGLISHKQLKIENDRLEAHRKIFLEYVKTKREELAATTIPDLEDQEEVDKKEV